MDQAKRNRIAALLAEGKAQAEIVRLTGIPQPTVSRYAADIAAAGDKRSRLLEIFRTAKREGNAREMRIASRELDKIHEASNPKPVATGELAPQFVAAVQSALGFYPNAKAETEVGTDDELLDELAKRHANNERKLASIARCKAVVLEISLPPEVEAVVTAYETEETNDEPVANDSDARKTQTDE
jgi:hypothetical protein